MDAISQSTFSNAFSSMKMHESRLRFHWSLFLRFELTIFQRLFRKSLGVSQATSHYLNQWWLVYRRIYASLGFNESSLLCGSGHSWRARLSLAHTASWLRGFDLIREEKALMGYQGLLRRLIPGNHQLFREKCLISTPPSGICDKVLENKCLSPIFNVFFRIILGHRRWRWIRLWLGTIGWHVMARTSVDQNLTSVWRNVAVIIRYKND